ncbi:type III secretion system effector EspK [Escherichia coli]|nr:type III secretion system effector EspK [Escherichia coli]MED0089830.1 type III secretion system effector EspK [Escherichia coli]MED0553155.1 type III secretion system effector EspK [Escherichia coli]MED9029656.1 type III secretion system effector EspK [Escherichia coli]MED9079242.1 type III secretion system effector EspK [Escherichia coli]
MLPTSQLTSSMMPYSNPAETSAGIKGEITLAQIEEARACGRLYVKDCDIEYLPQLPCEITSVTIENCNNLTTLTGLPVNIQKLSVINCEKLQITDIAPTVKNLHIELTNSPFIHIIPEGVECLTVCHCHISGVPESVRHLEVRGSATDSIKNVPNGLFSLSINSYSPENQARIDNLISSSLQTLSLTGCSNIILPEKLPKSVTSVTIHAEKKTTWNIGVKGMPDGVDLDLINVLLSQYVIKGKNITFQGNELDAALHFRLGDIVYGLSSHREKIVNSIKLVNDLSPKDIITQNTLTNAVWDSRTPRKYKQDPLIKRALNEHERGIKFKQHLKNHNNYNVTIADLSVYNRDKLWAKTSKAGLEFQTLIRNRAVMFCADELVNSLKLIADKSDGYGQSITASELRWIYRNKDNGQIMKNIKFYLRGKEIPAEKILGAPEWKDYKPKYSGATYKYS